MDIMNLFRRTVPQSDPAAMGNPASMGQQAPQNTPQGAGVVPQQQPNPQNQPVNQNPLDPNFDPQGTQAALAATKSPDVDFSKLWEIDPNKKGPADLAEFAFQFDPSAVQKQVSAMDFTKAITPEIATKIAAGGPEAVSAMLAAMNTVGQQVMHQTLLASTKVTESGIRNTGQRVKESLPNLVRSQSVSGALREDNPLFSDPAFSPIVSAIGEQIAQKFPQATPQEVREHTVKYFEQFAGTAARFAGKQVVDPATLPQSGLVNTKTVQVDWSREPT